MSFSIFLHFLPFLCSRRRSSSADSMEHALARPSSPRAARDHGSRPSVGSAAQSNNSETEGSQHSDQDSKAPKARPERRHGASAVPLSSGKIRYTGHKDIKLTLNKVRHFWRTSQCLSFGKKAKGGVVWNETVTLNRPFQSQILIPYHRLVLCTDMFYCVFLPLLPFVRK